MKLTRRGYGVIAVVVAAVISAGLFGARGLNAIAAPGVVALAYAAVQVWRFDPPSVERQLPRRGEQGATVDVELEFDVDRPYSARLVDAVDDGVEAAGNERAVTVGGRPVRYELFLRRRGDRTVGPATVRARDVLGLVSRTFVARGTASIRVRPPVYPLSGPRADDLVWTFGGGEDRQKFDFLRHYRRGDPLRDIHWPSSAKVPNRDFVVKEFSTEEGLASALVAGESTGGHDDAMAAAVASLADHLLAAGLEVGLVLTDATLKPRAGAEHRDQLLDTLALTRGGPVRERDRQRADIVVRADDGGTSVELGDGEARFSEVAGRPLGLPADEPGRREPAGTPGGPA